jgi:hypothetical protein
VYAQLTSVHGWVVVISKPSAPWVHVSPVIALGLDLKGRPEVLVTLGPELVPAKVLAASMFGVVHGVLNWEMLDEEVKLEHLKVAEVMGRKLALELGMGTTASQVEHV